MTLNARDVTECRFRPGCPQPAYDDGACYFHGKIRDGKITHTRGDGYDRESAKAKIVPIKLSDHELDAAERRLRAYNDQLLGVFDDDLARARRDREREDAEWIRAIGYRGVGDRNEQRRGRPQDDEEGASAVSPTDAPPVA